MRGVAPTGAAPLDRAAPQQDAELGYASDERVGTVRQRASAAATPTAAVQVSLTALLRDAPPESLDEARRRIAKLDRATLIACYRTAYAGGKLLAAYLLADELTERETPPWCWHETVPAPDSDSVTQRLILVLADLAWMRRWYPDHPVRYERGRAMLTGSEATFVREAEYAFYDGRRPVWRIVASLSMTAHQEWSCAYLRSVPIKKRAVATEAMSQRVLDALRHNLSKTRRVSFGLAEALASADRQHALWLCSRMVKGGSPTEIAVRYFQLTGLSIPRWTVAKQLAKVRAALREQGITS